MTITGPFSYNQIGLTSYPIRYQGYSDIAPFTYRSGRTYQEVLETLRTWIPDILLPGLEQNFSNVTDALVLVESDVEARITDAIGEFVFAEQNAVGAVLLRGVGIDETGATPSDAAVQVFLDAVSDGTTVVVPSGSIISFASGVTINHRIRFTGNGELRYTGTSGGALLTVNHDGVHLDGLYATNPGAILKSCIRVTANVFRATNNHLTGWRDGIQVMSTGEFHDVVISGNQILDIIGSGLGSGNSTANGESDGDGIVCWGAAVTITNNRVTCKAGSDSRIGIHVESLYQQEIDQTYPHRDSLATITGNVVTGKFRRSIVSEGVAHAVIVGNVVADATWWSIALIGLAHHSIIAHNTIKYTRTAADTQGSSATPHQAAIMLFTIQEALSNCIIDGNVIDVVAGSTIKSGIVLQSDASVASNAAIGLKVTNNQIRDFSATMATGVNIAASTTGTEIHDNRIPVFQTNGVYAYIANSIAVSRNKLIGRGNVSPVRGVFLDGGASDATITNNWVENVLTAIATQFRSGILLVNDNVAKTAGVGWDAFTSTSAVGISTGNVYSGVTTKTQNIPVGITLGTNN